MGLIPLETLILSSRGHKDWKKVPGVDFFFVGPTTTYVIRHRSKYGNMTSSSHALSTSTTLHAAQTQFHGDSAVILAKSHVQSKLATNYHCFTLCHGTATDGILKAPSGNAHVIKRTKKLGLQRTVRQLLEEFWRRREKRGRSPRMYSCWYRQTIRKQGTLTDLVRSVSITYAYTLYDTERQ